MWRQEKDGPLFDKFRGEKFREIFKVRRKSYLDLRCAI